MNQAKSPEQGIHLATELDFYLGQLWISPSTGRVRGMEGEIRVEPRVMQVLVTLGRSAGSTVTRESLVQSCWAGRAVSDDAVARVIAKVRQLARNEGEPYFRIETIPKVGFRLVATAPAQVGETIASKVAAAIVAVVCIGLLSLSTPRTDGNSQVSAASFTAEGSDDATQRLSQELEEGVVQFLSQAGMPPGDRPEFTVGGVVRGDHDRHVVSTWIRDSDTGSTLWSSRSTLEGSDLEGAVEGVSDQVATTLKCALDVRNRAFDARQLSLLLSACSAIINGPDALGATERLVAAAPEVAGAHALRAIALASYARSLDHVDSAARSAEARAAAARAIEINPNTALAHLALGVLSDSSHRFGERQQHLLRALELDPALMWARVGYTELLQEVGQPRAAANVAYLIENSNDHFVRSALPRFAFLHAQLGEHPEAQRLMGRLDRMNSRVAAAVRWTSAIWWERPTQITARVWDLGLQSASTIGIECLREYMGTLANATGKPLRGLPDSCAGMEIDWRVRMLAREGDLDGAYDLMKSDLPFSRTTMFLFYPEMKRFRADARFGPLAERLGLLAFWRETHQWPDSCADEGADWCDRSQLATAADQTPQHPLS